MRIRLFLSGLAFAALGACSSSSSPVIHVPEGDAQLAVLNALPSGEQVTLRLDGEVLTVPTTGTRSSRAITAGTHRLTIEGTDLSNLLPVDFTVASNGRRSVVLARSGSASLAMLVTTDTASLPPAGAAKIRVVHAVDGVEPMVAWLRLSSAARDSAARFVTPFNRGVGTNAEFPGYAVRPPGEYLVTATSIATGDVLVETRITMGAGEVWSAVLTRTQAGGLTFQPVREN